MSKSMQWLIWMTATLGMLVVRSDASCNATQPHERAALISVAPDEVRWASLLREDFNSLAELLPKREASDTLEAIEAAAGEASRLLLAGNTVWTDTQEGPRQQRQQLPDVDAIRLFVSLPSAVSECNFQAYLVLARNFEAAIGTAAGALSARRVGSDEAKDPVRSTVLAAIKLHAQNCHSSYYDSFRARIEAIDSKVMAGIEQVIDCELLERLLGSSDSIPGGKMIQLDATDLIRDAWSEILADKLLELAVRNGNRADFPRAADRWGRRVGANPSLEMKALALAGSLVDSCQIYSEQLADIFYPAQLDSMLLDGGAAVAERIDREHDQKFTAAWERFTVCSAFSNYRHHLDTQLSLIMRRRTRLV